MLSLKPSKIQQKLQHKKYTVPNFDSLFKGLRMNKIRTNKEQVGMFCQTVNVILIHVFLQTQVCITDWRGFDVRPVWTCPITFIALSIANLHSQGSETYEKWLKLLVMSWYFMKIFYNDTLNSSEPMVLLVIRWYTQPYFSWNVFHDFQGS